jgi:regulator of protease activity HflC (stomatin/prohibitin superfamily)
MRADFLTYRRAMNVSLLGLVLQALLAIALAVYARYSGGHHAATTAAIAGGIGCLVWFALLVLFDQHRRERLEAIEAESLAAAETAAASAFEVAGEDMRVAARRLAAVRRFFLPGMSLLIGGLFIAVGLLRLRTGRPLFDADTFDKVTPTQPGWGVAVGLGAAFVGFVFARFVSGMAKQPAWTALRAGAAQIVAVALLGLVLAIGLFIKLAAGPDLMLRVLSVAYPIVLIAMGAEVFLNFVLDLYRPRTPGEDPRPAFDSRFLGFAAAPDRIAESVGDALNYQFGVDVKSSWFYQLLSRSVMLLVLLALVIAWGLTSLVVVQPHQTGLVLRFGEVSRPILSFGSVREVERTAPDGRTRTVSEIGPGLHVKLPWPFSSVVMPEHVQAGPNGREYRTRTTTGVQVLQLGTNPPDAGTEPILWGKQHAAVEYLNIVQSGSTGRPLSAAGSASSGGLSLLAVEVPVHYRVADSELYERIATPDARHSLLGALGRRVVTRYLASMSIDEVIASARADLAERLKVALVNEFGTLNGGEGAGIEILFVGVNGVHPPRDVAPNFERVVQARQNREAKIEEATKFEIKQLADAAGSVDLARQIASQLDELDRRSRGGAEQTELAALEIDVQKLLEEAGGEAGKLLLESGSQRWQQHMGERARAALFAAQSQSYAAAPALFRTQMYLDALRDTMAGSRVFLVPDDLPSKRLRLELQDQRIGRDVFDPTAGGEAN